MSKKSSIDKDNNSFDRDRLLQQKVIFCTECGVQLTNFCFTERAKDPDAVRKSLAQCKKTGKFNGEFCSKLFISNDDNMAELWDEDDFGF
jgi:hypothetical protein